MLAGLSLLFTFGATMRAQQSAQPYPVAVGNYWVYRTRVVTPVMHLASGQRLPSEVKQRTQRSEITQVVYRKDGIQPGPLSPSIAAAFFDNLPLASSPLDDGKKTPGILMIVSSRFYEIPLEPSEFPALLRRVQDPHDRLSDLLSETTPILDLPLAPGKSWGVPFSTWSVTQRAKSSLTGVRGAGVVSNPEGFDLETSDNTGTVRFTFVPGIGITHVSKKSLFPPGAPNHWELDARLVEVHLNQTEAAKR